MSTDVTQGIKAITLDATVIRADGTIEELGTVAEYDPKSKRRGLGSIRIGNLRHLLGSNA